MANYFLGFYDIASQLMDLREGLIKAGHNAKVGLVRTSSVIVRNEGDYIIQDTTPLILRVFPGTIVRYFRDRLIRSKKKRLWRQHLKETDVFVFIWESFEKNFRDLKKIKDLNKKIVVFLVGDDVRWYEAMKQEAKLKRISIIEYQNYFLHNRLQDKLEKLRNAEKYADLIFSHPDISQLGIRPYHHYFIPINIRQFRSFEAQRKDRPLVIHAPSDRSIKGTKYIIDAVEKLELEAIDFDFRLIENTPYLQAIEIYKECDILVGQLLAHGGGKQGHELLSLGKVVISRMDYSSYIDCVAEECPIIDANPSNIYQVLKDTILNYQLRCQLARRGPEYIKKYHDVDSICKMIHQSLFDAPIAPNYFPDFFLNKFIPEQDLVQVYNKMTDKVKNCDWYKKYVKSKKRDGLVF